MSKETEKNIINAYPKKDLFISILVRDISIRDAIGDLLDNSVDGALRLRPNGDFKGLWIKIELDTQNKRFVIQDNCGGIPIDIARNHAFCFGRSDDTETTGHSVGAFGIGMKRAFFRLGKKITVTSIAKDSSFKMTVDVDEWKKNIEPDSWYFKFDEYQEDLVKENPEAKCGTKIEVTQLLSDVSNTFSINLEVAKLIEELQREHLFNIDKGLHISFNDMKSITTLDAPELKLLASDDFKTAYWENLEGPVKVRIFAGISEQETYGHHGGWYIFCNMRLVLGPDQTNVTGWGADFPTRIPKYHSQFYRFRGYVFLDAEEPRDLPWNTTKTDMDLDSPTYRAVLQHMIILMRSVTDFLNQLHTEVQDHNKGKIAETPSQDAIKKAEIVSLNKVRQTQAYLNLGKFLAPKRAMPKKPMVEQVTIRYMVPKERYDAVKEYFKTDKQADVGLGTFNYFFEREVKE